METSCITKGAHSPICLLKGSSICAGTSPTVHNAAATFVDQISVKAVTAADRADKSGPRPLLRHGSSLLLSFPVSFLGIEPKRIYMTTITIRLHPARFWAATKSMLPEQQEALLNAIALLAEIGDVEGLEHFDFVTIDDKRASVA